MEIRMPADLVPGENSIPGLQMATFQLCPYIVQKEKEKEKEKERQTKTERHLVSSSSYQDINPLMGALLDDLIYLNLITSKGPTPNNITSHWGLGLPMNFGRGHIQIITDIIISP